MKTNTQESQLANSLGLGQLNEIGNIPGTAYECNAFIFEQTDEPVMSRRSIGREPQPIPGRFKWVLQYYRTTYGGYWEPDDVSLVDHDSYDSLWDAVRGAALLRAQWRIDNICEGIGLHELAEQEASL